jgi:Trp operon repressor
MSRKPSGYPSFIKKFRATEEEWQEFLKLCPDDAREAFLVVFNALLTKTEDEQDKELLTK